MPEDTYKTLYLLFSETDAFFGPISFAEEPKSISDTFDDIVEEHTMSAVFECLEYGRPRELSLAMYGMRFDEALTVLDVDEDDYAGSSLLDGSRDVTTSTMVRLAKTADMYVIRQFGETIDKWPWHKKAKKNAERRK